MTDADDLILERRGPILIVRLNRPEARNSLTPQLIRSIGASMTEAESDPGVRAVVLTATGDRAFCAGMDLRSFANDDMDIGQSDAVTGFNRLLRGELTLPVIGAANGTAVAGGLELLLGCDILVASSAASFGLPEVKRGLFPAGRGTFIGTRIPLSIALEMVLTGESIDAARAFDLGLVNAVVPPDDVLVTALGYAERIATNGPLGVAAAKELVRLGVSDPDHAADRLQHWQEVVFASEDAKEGATAFVEKRAAVWKGR
jgi:enoyl-CoA hydratase/carnithine racemase